MGLFRRRCDTCETLRSENAWLRQQLEAQAAQRDRLLDRVAAVARPELAPTLAAGGPQGDCHTWAHDENGTVLFVNGQEVPVIHREDGTPCVMVGADPVPVDEFTTWMQRAQQEASGASPAEETHGG
jgi:hypothetical protein